VDELAKNASIHFNVQPVKDGLYGSMVGGEWNGMIGELLKNVRKTLPRGLKHCNYCRKSKKFSSQ